MNDLEAASRPWLIPMIRGESVDLSPAAQTVIARWAAKTATMFHYAYNSQATMPPDRLRHLRTEDYPPDDVHVWLAASASKVQPAEYMIGSLHLKTPGLTDTDAELLTLCVGQLAVQVFAVTLTGRPRTIEHRFDDRIRQIWPDDGASIDWPPPAFLDSQLEAFYMRFITANEPFPFMRRPPRLSTDQLAPGDARRHDNPSAHN